MQDPHWKINRKTLRPPAYSQPCKLRKPSVQVIDDFLQPRLFSFTPSPLHTRPSRCSSSLMSRKGSIPSQSDSCLRTKTQSRMKKTEQVQTQSVPNFLPHPQKIHFYSLIESDHIYDLQAKSLQPVLFPQEIASMTSLLATQSDYPQSLLSSIQPQLASHLTSVYKEKTHLQHLSFPTYNNSPTEMQAFSAVKQGDFECVKSLIETQKSLLFAVDAVGNM